MVLKKILVIFVLGMGLFISSCENTFELEELLDDPNFPVPEEANIDALYASVQVNFAEFLQAEVSAAGNPVLSLNNFAMQLSRQIAFTAGLEYANAFAAPGFNNIWREAYSNFAPDAAEIINQAEARNLPFQAGTAKILQGYAFMTLVDIFGDVPFSEINQGSDILSPSRDPGQSVYAAAEALLLEGIADLEPLLALEDQPTLFSDNFFDSDISSWINAGRSTLIKLYVSSKLVDNTAGMKMMEIGNNADYNPVNFYFQYTTSRANPDSRHPFYADAYEDSDGDYQSNWFMWALNQEKGIVDPRIRSYFYRQVGEVPLDNPNVFDCVFSTLPDASATPQHYLDCDPNMPYCVASITDGYYGRDHGNGNGIPPDGAIRTVYGVYPAGGRFDASTFDGTQNQGVDGGQGAGVFPLIPANFISFYRAEAALTMNTGEDARALLEAGVRESISNVVDFTRATDPGSLSEVVATMPTVVTGEDFLPAEEDVDAYVTEVLNLYDAATDKLDVVMKEFLIASYGNGIEGYNMIRRTGRPLNLQPTILENSGSFIRSALYPADHVNLNENATQKSVTDQVFWDTNPANFIK